MDIAITCGFGSYTPNYKYKYKDNKKFKHIVVETIEKYEVMTFKYLLLNMSAFLSQ
jgi:hypothetical protein